MLTRKEKSNIKHDCLCGGKFTHKHKSTHLKTKKHKNLSKLILLKHLLLLQ